ncbi:putative O-methyltransferase [Bisporella sp. PMI_857]|nr:putative O-methyltransferase [Bisporella sp. PMI_857]
MLNNYATSLESPPEFIWRMIMEPHKSASVRTALEMGVIDAISSSNGPTTSADLANATNADKQLIVRVLRPLTAMKIVDEVGIETYNANPISRILTVQAIKGGFKFDEAAKSVVNMPEFLHKTAYKNPQGPMGCFQDTFQTDLQMFPWLIQHPDQMRYFNDLMAGQKMNRVDWFAFADAKSILFDGYKVDGQDPILLVDVGGNRGEDLEAIKRAFPDAQGKLVVQDLPPVIDDIKELSEDIVRMKHDFFTPQPIKGARAYYLRYILHDYSDPKSLEILRHIVNAMKPGYSKLLIFESVLPEMGTPLWPALLDINMIALLSGMERSKAQWTGLLNEVGLDLVRIWEREGDTEGLIEAVKRR